MTGYSSGMRRERIEIWRRKAATVGRFGVDSGGVDYAREQTVWASVTWVKGLRALSVGAIDAYGVILVRMLWTPCVDMRSRIRWGGQMYQVLPETFHADRQQNQVQFQAQVVVE